MWGGGKTGNLEMRYFYLFTPKTGRKAERGLSDGELVAKGRARDSSRVQGGRRRFAF